MPRLIDKNQIRAVLRRDPIWSVYALGDLAPHMFGKTQWFFTGFSTGVSPDLTLVLHDYGTSILFAMGPGSVREALEHATWPVHLQVQGDALEEVGRYATLDAKTSMWRMGWSGAVLPPASGATRLGAPDVDALKRLYADGDATGEAPDFFYPSMVTDGVFCGVYEGDALIAAAGTHLMSREESAAAIGNVYTRRDRRGRGLGRVVTTAVIDALAGIETIGLNVRADNETALHLYESLGFERHCTFFEGLATRVRPSSG